MTTIIFYVLGSIIQFIIIYKVLVPYIENKIIKTQVQEYVRQAIILSETRLRDKIAVLETALATYPAVIKELQDDVNDLYSQGQQIQTVDISPPKF